MSWAAQITGTFTEPETRLDGALSVDRLAPHWEIHLLERCYIAYPGIDDQCLGRRGPSARWQADRRSSRLHRVMWGPPPARRPVCTAPRPHKIIQLSPGGAQTVTAGPGNGLAGVDRPHIRCEQADAPLRLVNGGHAISAQCLAELPGRDACDLAHGNMLANGILLQWLCCGVT